MVKTYGKEVESLCRALEMEPYPAGDGNLRFVIQYPDKGLQQMVIYNPRRKFVRCGLYLANHSRSVLENIRDVVLTKGWQERLVVRMLAIHELVARVLPNCPNKAHEPSTLIPCFTGRKRAMYYLCPFECAGLCHYEPVPMPARDLRGIRRHLNFRRKRS